MKDGKFNTFASVTKMPYGKTKEEHKAYHRWWRNKNLGEYNKKRLEWSNKHRERRTLQAKRSHLSKTFGMTLEDFQALLRKQKNKCKICGKEFKKVTDKTKRTKYTPYLDHCHESAKVRGVLCFNCNTGLGHFRDNTKLLNNAIRYLKEYLDDKSINPKSLEGSTNDQE